MTLDQLKSELEGRFGRVQRSSGRNGIELITTCPTCGKKKLSVNANLGVYKCWHGCGSGTIRELLGRPIDLSRIEKPKPRHFGYIEPGETIGLGSLGDDHPAIVYLKARGFDPMELSTLYGIEYCSNGRTFAQGVFDTSNTILIPYVKDGKRIGWQSRLLYNPDTLDDTMCELLGFRRKESGKFEKPPKYFTMPGFDKSQNLFNYDNAIQSDLVVVTEGAFDAMAVGRCAVAAFGKRLSDEQVSILRTRWKLVVLLLDPDAEDEQKLLEHRLRGVSSVSIRLKGYKDAGEAPRMEIWKQIDETLKSNQVNLSNYRFII